MQPNQNFHIKLHLIKKSLIAHNLKNISQSYLKTIIKTCKFHTQPPPATSSTKPSPSSTQTITSPTLIGLIGRCVPGSFSAAHPPSAYRFPPTAETRGPLLPPEPPTGSQPYAFHPRKVTAGRGAFCARPLHPGRRRRASAGFRLLINVVFCTGSERGFHGQSSA